MYGLGSATARKLLIKSIFFDLLNAKVSVDSVDKILLTSVSIYLRFRKAFYTITYVTTALNSLILNLNLIYSG